MSTIKESLSYDSYSTGWGPFINDASEYGAFQFPSGGMGGWTNPAQLAMRNNYLSGEQLPIYLNWWQLKAIRDRARYIHSTNEFAHGLVQCFQSFVVGATGFKWRVASVDLKNPVQEEYLKRCQVALDMFREYNNLVEVENEIVYRLHVDGEVFLRKFPQSNGMLVIRFIEPELVRGYSSDMGNPAESFGIITERDDINTVLGYKVILKPYETQEPTLLKAREIIHIKIGTNANAKRGLTTFYPVFQNLANCEDILASTVTMAKARAKIAMIRKINNVTPDSMSDLVTAQVDATVTGPMGGSGGTEPTKLERFGYGTILTAPANIEYEFPGANVDAAGLIQVLQANLRSLATRFGISETLMSGDASNNNYSSALIAEAPARRTFERWQGIIGRQLAESRFQPNRSLAWEQLYLAADHGIIPEDILLNIKITSEAFSLQSREHQKEAEMNNMYHSMGVKSIQTIRAEIGLDNDTEASNFIKPTIDSESSATDTDPMTGSPRISTTSSGGSVGGGGEVQDSALNGSQIANLIDVVHRCTIGEIPIESGKAIARASFPSLTTEIIQLIFRDVVVKIPPVESPTLPTQEIPSMEKRNTQKAPKPKIEKKV